MSLQFGIAQTRTNPVRYENIKSKLHYGIKGYKSFQVLFSMKKVLK